MLSRATVSALWSEWLDSNQRPRGPQPRVLALLNYILIVTPAGVSQEA